MRAPRLLILFFALSCYVTAANNATTKTADSAWCTATDVYMLKVRKAGSSSLLMLLLELAALGEALNCGGSNNPALCGATAGAGPPPREREPLRVRSLQGTPASDTCFSFDTPVQWGVEVVGHISACRGGASRDMR